MLVVKKVLTEFSNSAIKIECEKEIAESKKYSFHGKFF